LILVGIRYLVAKSATSDSQVFLCLCYTKLMPKVLTDKVLIDKFLERGVENIYPDKESLRQKLLSGDRLRVYQGFDPTGPFLHIGHAIGIRALRILQQLGHEVIFLVGDYTSRVGDPDPSQDSMRTMLTPDQIKKNEQGWKEQAAQLIDFKGKNPVQFKHNYEWLSNLDLEDLIKLMGHATVQQIIERDLFQRRLAEGNPIGLQEFIYPLMQGYDSVAMKVDMEIGGTDQIFNMLMGRTLCKAYLNKEKFVRANVLMEAPNAVTMSKTKGNSINLSDTPEDMFGKAMSYSDELIIKGMTLLTDVAMEDISEIEKQISSGANPMQFKKFMAFEIVKIIKGEKAAEQAQLHFEKTVQEGEVPSEAVELELSGEMRVVDLAGRLNEKAGAGLSSSEIKRIIKQGGFEVNNQKYSDLDQAVKLASGDTIKLGKRIFGKIK